MVFDEVFATLKKVILELDLLDINEDEFGVIRRCFFTASERCDPKGRDFLEEEDLVVVDNCLAEMLAVLSGRTRRTDRSDLATDFALAVVGALFLVGRKELPWMGELPTPDIIYYEDRLTKEEASPMRIALDWC